MAWVSGLFPGLYLLTFKDHHKHLWCVFGVIVLEHLIVSKFQPYSWWFEVGDGFEDFVNCTSSTAPEHYTSTTKLTRWYSVPLYLLIEAKQLSLCLIWQQKVSSRRLFLWPRGKLQSLVKRVSISFLDSSLSVHSDVNLAWLCSSSHQFMANLYLDGSWACSWSSEPISFKLSVTVRVFFQTLAKLFELQLTCTCQSNPF